mgnify:CR=1 FL=1
MNRHIKLDENNVVIGIRYGEEIVEGEIQSDIGELGQIMQPDGTFVTPEPEPIKSEPNPIIERLDLLIQMQLEREGII